MCSCSLLFFFKQKTAYEMRISDWSSDVCSSDLLVAAGPRADFEHRGALVGDVLGEQLDREIMFGGGQRRLDCGNFLGRHRLHLGEIGRASCRERVCQYV